jgi:hypothetical protein
MALPSVCFQSASAKSVQLAKDTSHIQYDAAPAWVLAPPNPTKNETPTGAPYRVIYSDTQIRILADHVETHSAFRAKILTSQALAIGALRLDWNPASQDVTVHTLRIYREGQIMDVLASNHFAILQREANLEASILTGVLTATMQVPGLQVGDEVEFATTIRERDTVFGNHTYGANLMFLAEGLGANRVSLAWDPARVPRFQASPDIPKALLRENAAVWIFNDPGKVETIDGAPPRYNVRRLIEYSDFADWKQLSAAIFPLFAKASILPSDSPIITEVERIAKETPDSVQRAGAALKLVQDRIRYVFVGLNGANFRPMDIATTWRSRFGDCKAKSVLLQAILQRLGITSEIVLVNSQGGDDIPTRLPSPLAFDHALVRASIDGRTYYLDGTKDGDRALPLLEPTRYRAVLPLRAGGGDLEQPKPKPPGRPDLIRTVDIDWSGGLDQLAKVTANRYILGENSTIYHAQLAALSPEQADRALRAYWSKEDGWVEPEAVSWRYDDANSAIVLTVTGKGHGDWSGDDRDGHSNTIPYAGSYPPPERKRPAAQNQTIPWANEFPGYSCSIVNIRLPKPSAPHLIWDFRATPFDTRIGGIHYVRRSSMENGIVRALRIYKAYLPEIQADEAAQANRAIPGFDNSMGQVFEQRNNSSHARAVSPSSLPRIGDVDWLKAETACTVRE